MAETNLRGVVDFPKVRHNNCGGVSITRPKSLKNELAWTRDLLDHYEHWRDLVNLPAMVRLDLEYSPRPEIMRHRRSRVPRSVGLPRIDAVIHHEDGTVTLLEAKVSSAPSDVMGGVGQLIYYQTIYQAYENKRVQALVLAAAFLPPFVLDSIAHVQAPIRFLKSADGEYNGLVPQY